VKHTARDVEYKIDKFIDKNKDEVSDGIKRAIHTCKNSIVKIYYNNIEENEFTIPNLVEVKEKLKSDSKEKFLAYNFTKDMNNLIKELTSSECHFVRCVKPNELKKADHWIFYLVLK